MKNTYYEFELNNGEKVNLTLQFAALYMLKTKNKQSYEACNRIMMDGAKEIMDMVQIIYVAYLCANIKDYENCMDFENFVALVPFDVEQIKDATVTLLQAKKK